MITETIVRARRTCNAATLLVGMLAATLTALPAQAARNALENRYDVAIYANGGKPDLTVDLIRLKSQLNVIDRYFDPNDAGDRCAVAEGAVGDFG